MGKGTGLFGNYRKKIGNTVGYTLKNSNNAQTQGVRIYQPVVTNPKSDPQSAQRMKLMPLQIFYQSFSDVLNHAFEGKRVGQMNRQRFMQLNMGKTSGIAPAVQKGERILVPIKCQVSSGSLTMNTALAKVDADSSLITQSLRGEESITNFSGFTLKEFSVPMISRNLGLESGMEIAFIIIVASTEDPRAGVPMKFSIVLSDTDEVTTIGDLMGASVSDYVRFGSDDDGFLTIKARETDNPILGAALIISKKNASGWSNTNSRFFPTTLGEQLFYDAALYNAALATYGPSGSTLTSDLFLRQADNAAGIADPNAIVESAANAIVLTGDYAGGVLSSANGVLATTRGGYKRVVVSSYGSLVDANGAIISVTHEVDGESVTEPVMPSMTSWSGLGTVEYGSF